MVVEEVDALVLSVSQAAFEDIKKNLPGCMVSPNASGGLILDTDRISASERLRLCRALGKSAKEMDCVEGLVILHMDGSEPEGQAKDMIGRFRKEFPGAVGVIRAILSQIEKDEGVVGTGRCTVSEISAGLVSIRERATQSGFISEKEDRALAVAAEFIGMFK